MTRRLAAGDRVILVGAGRFAEEVTDLAADVGIVVEAWIEGLDPARADGGHDPPIVWLDDQATFEPGLPVTPAIGAVRRRALVERLVAEGRALASVVHPSAVVARTAILEPGCVVFPGVVMGARTRIGRGTIVNRGALIGHHVTVGEGSFIGPGANVGGGAVLGAQVHVGIGAVIRDDRRVGDRSTVGAGAVVVADVEADVTVVGVPAKPMIARSG
jgi:sugar O-acyltransferase (sialic acid O-acetyltransferase NeuD family)